ncbi:MAG: VWA domain-containing protein, partial [Acidobacteria bacterium]
RPGGGATFSPVVIARTGTSGAEVASESSSAERVAKTPPFRSGVTYVSVPVVVKDAKGRPVPDLTMSDFRIYEDDVEQKIDRLITMSAPFDVGLVVDTSASMRGELVDLHNGVLRFIERLRAEDRLLLISFDDRVFVQTELTPERARQRNAASQVWLGRGQGTRLYDAIDLVIARRVPAMADRKAIVLFTDGVDTRSRIADADSSQDLIAGSNVPVYVIQYDTRADDYSLPYGVRTQGLGIRDMVPRLMPEGAEDDSELFKRADSFLAAITDLSGGRRYRTFGVGHLNEAFAQITRDLAEQYTLWYYPTKQATDGGYRKLRVEVDKPDVQVRTRAGYRAASTLQTPAAPNATLPSGRERAVEHGDHARALRSSRSSTPISLPLLRPSPRAAERSPGSRPR